MNVAVSAIKAFCKTCTSCGLKQAFLKSKPQKAIMGKIASLSADVVDIKPGRALRGRLLAIRNAYLKENPEAFHTLDHIKSNYDNTHIIGSVKGQTEALDAVSTDDFCNLSQIMKGIRTPEEMTVYRAMEAGDFNIGTLSPEEFFAKYYKEGKTVTIPIYMSSSLDKNIAYRFAKNRPNRFIIKLKVPKDHPAVYMERLAPCDGVHYGFEDELNIIKNSQVKFGKLVKGVNPVTNEPIYELEGTIVGFRDIKPKPKPEFVMDDEMMELFKALTGIN